MKLDKAIGILSEETKHPYSIKKMGRPDAIKLGIEALKRIEWARNAKLWYAEGLLPGETEETK